MMKACDYSLEGYGGALFRDGFSREEIEQNIQYDLICEHNFGAVFEFIVRALSLFSAGVVVAFTAM